MLKAGYWGVRLGGWVTWNRYRLRNWRWKMQKSINSLRKEDPMFLMTVENWSRNIDGLS